MIHIIKYFITIHKMHTNHELKQYKNIKRVRENICV